MITGITERPNAHDFYYIRCNGVPIQPTDTDMIMDYWTAETVACFLESVNPFFTFEIIKAEIGENNAIEQQD